ncbi:MAG: DinB family protein [Planctomycetes bacterium]|nr:DinB family protein [Planctomycetota bacterium]
MELAPVTPETLAERYLAAVDAFIEGLRSVNPDLLDWHERADTWSARDVAFHVAEIDQMLGLRLRRILGEDHPDLAGVDTQAGVRLFRRSKLDLALALDCLSATCALNTALIEKLSPEDLKRKGRHSQGHDVTAADLASFMAFHIEAHVKQIARIKAAARR